MFSLRQSRIPIKIIFSFLLLDKVRMNLTVCRGRGVCGRQEHPFLFLFGRKAAKKEREKKYRGGLRPPHLPNCKVKSRLVKPSLRAICARGGLGVMKQGTQGSLLAVSLTSIILIAAVLFVFLLPSSEARAEVQATWRNARAA